MELTQEDPGHIDSCLMVMSFTYLSTAFALSATSLQRRFHASSEVITLGLSLYVLGFALGPLLMVLWHSTMANALFT